MSDYASEAGHWYEPNGKTAYEYQVKLPDGTAIWKKTTLREARKYGWYPSFTGVWGVISAPPLEAWRRGKLLGICAENPRRDDEGLQAYINRITALYEAEMDRPPDLGSHIHGCIERHLAGQDYDKTYSNHVMGAVAAVDSWCGVAGLSTEKSFAHPLGYGGKCDAHKRVLERTLPFYGDWVLDFKTKEFGETNLPGIYDNHFGQLASYRNGLGLPNARCAIIYISTLEPGLTHTVELTEAQLQHGWSVFCAALNLWKIVKKYDPCKQMELV